MVGCTSVRYAKLHTLSDPPGAHVSIVETGEYLRTAPDTIVVWERFFILKPRRARYHLLFRNAQGCRDVVEVEIAAGWARTRRAADESLTFRTVHGLLKETACQE
jgi:hypothetical protein